MENLEKRVKLIEEELGNIWDDYERNRARIHKLQELTQTLVEVMCSDDFLSWKHSEKIEWINTLFSK